MSVNTDSKKLEIRIETHKQFSTYDINDWILSCVQPQKNNPGVAYDRQSAKE
ncbi:MAG: hypothetical protein IH795_01515 [Bacteroidetes bacterium]|nr:hypothetical protein [Bacteroidota bacterium]